MISLIYIRKIKMDTIPKTSWTTFFSRMKRMEMSSSDIHRRSFFRIRSKMLTVLLFSEIRRQSYWMAILPKPCSPNKPTSSTIKFTAQSASDNLRSWILDQMNLSRCRGSMRTRETSHGHYVAFSQNLKDTTASIVSKNSSWVLDLKELSWLKSNFVHHQVPESIEPLLDFSTPEMSLLVMKQVCTWLSYKTVTLNWLV